MHEVVTNRPASPELMLARRTLRRVLIVRRVRPDLSITRCVAHSRERGERWDMVRGIGSVVEVSVLPDPDNLSSHVLTRRTDHIWADTSRECDLVLVLVLVLTENMVYIDSPVCKNLVLEAVLRVTSNTPLPPGQSTSIVTVGLSGANEDRVCIGCDIVPEVERSGRERAILWDDWR